MIGSASEQKRIAIVQSNYIPWKGYFDMMGSVDEFVLLDDVQYTRRDWRNRNRIKTPQGIQWLTIPVQVKGKFDQEVRHTRISDPAWRRRHWDALRHSYARARCFSEMEGVIYDLYEAASDEYLSKINYRFLVGIRDLLNIGSKISWSMDYGGGGRKTQRLLDICLQANASEYLSGPSARAYLDVRLFNESGIHVSWMDYEGYSEYDQLYPPFEHRVSVLDLIFHTGADAGAYLLSSDDR